MAGPLLTQIDLWLIADPVCFLNHPWQASHPHSDLFSEFWFGKSFYGYTAHFWLSSIPLVFLGIKDYRKNEKGQQRL